MVFRPIRLPLQEDIGTECDAVLRPSKRQVIEHLSDQRVGGWVAEEDEVFSGNVLIADVNIVFDRKFAAPDLRPFRLESFQAGPSVFIGGRVPGLSRAANAK